VKKGEIKRTREIPDTPARDTWADRFFRVRAALGLSQEDFGGLLGSSRTQVRLVESRGKRPTRLMKSRFNTVCREKGLDELQWQ